MMLSSNEEMLTTSDESSLSFDYSNQQLLTHEENPRIDALRNLQISYNQLESGYLKSVQELEYQFHEQCSYLFERRSNIIAGKYEPTDEECRLKTEFIEINERSFAAENQTGIPSFWLQTLQQVRLRIGKSRGSRRLLSGSDDCGNHRTVG